MINGSADGNVEWDNLALADLPDLATFAPEDWGMRLDTVLLQHVTRSYFHARVARVAGAVVAVGQGLATGATGWIGNIIVRPDARRRGFGSRMTAELVCRLREQGCSSILLVATEMGAPVYRRLGFRSSSEYVFLDVPRLAWRSFPRVRRLHPVDVADVFSLDAAATGESRVALLEPHLPGAWVRVDAGDVPEGVFVPSFGAGLIIAESPAAGLELLEFKHALYPGPAVVPADNPCAVRFLLEHGARETSRSPRMVLGEEVWSAAWVFARGSGYTG